MALLCCCVSDVRAQAVAQREAPATISGRVVRDGGEGLRGIVVTLVAPDPATRFRAVARTTTGADGRYILSDVQPGRYWVLPRAGAYVIVGAAGFPPGKQVIVEAGETVDDFDIKLTRGGVITGRVTNADGKPLIRETVVITSAGPSRAETAGGVGPYRDLTDDRGIYRVYGLPAGGYRVSAGRGEEGGIYAGPNGSFRRVYYPGTPVEAEAKLVEVSAGGEVGDVDITLGAPVKTFRASGRVVAEDGKGVPGVRLEYAAALRGDAGATWLGATLSDARGEFQFQRVTPGRYVVFTSTEDAGEWYGESAPFVVEASDVRGLEVRIRRGASLSGSVQIEGMRDRAKISHLISQIALNVSYEPRGGPAAANYHRTVKVAPDGSFRVDGLRPGTVRLGTGWPTAKGLTLLRIEYEGADRSQHGILVGEGAQLTGVRAVYAYGDASVRGQINVVNGTLPPQARLAVFVMRPGSGGHFAGRHADVDARGRFTVGGLPPGDYELVVRAYGPGVRQLEVKQRLTLPEDGETAVTVALDAGGESN